MEVIKMLSKKTLVAIYSRVSTVEQAEEGYSIDEQERLLIAWCNKMDYIVTKCYSDRGISGKNMSNRPGLKELLHDAEEKKFDMVLSWKINRISRKLIDVLKIVDLLEENNITFKSYSEPLTGILKCPKCGAGMVISRTTNKLADGTKKRIAYYACGNWKNKGTAVCNSNTIRADKANTYVFSKLSELLSNEKMIKAIVNNVNKERVRKVNPTKKDLSKIDNELEKLDKKRAKLFEAYEDEIITKDEFKVRKDELMQRVKTLEAEKAPLLVTLSDDVNEELPYDFIKSILENFSKILTESTTREQQKKLLHMIISEITINELREIDSIKIKLDDNLINYLSNEEGVSMKGTPSSFMLRNVGIKTLNLDIAI